MLMTNFLKGRKSVREFKKRKLSFDLLEDIKGYIRTLEDDADGIGFKLYEYGEKVYDDLKGIGGYSGVMIEAPHYIGLEMLKDDDKTIIYSSYYMEKLITKLNFVGLDTCWVSMLNIDHETKTEVFGDLRGKIDYILAIGHGKARNPFVNEPFSERIGVDELVFSEEINNPINMEDLENRGLDDLFYYVRFAPSALNKQPWRFILSKDKVTLLLNHDKDEKPNLIDAGIIMYYFEVLGEAIGLSSRWELTLDKDEENYKYIAEINL